MTHSIIAVGDSTLPVSAPGTQATVTVAVVAGTELIDSYADGVDTEDIGASGTVVQIAQKIINGNFNLIKSVVLKSGGKQAGGAIVGNVTVGLYSDVEGVPTTDLGSSTFDDTSYPADLADVTVTFTTPIAVTPFATYWIFIGVADQSATDQGPIIYLNGTDGDETAETSTDGTTWAAITDGQLNYEVYGVEPAMTSDDKVIITPTTKLPRDLLMEHTLYVDAKTNGSFTVKSSGDNLPTAITFDYVIVSGTQDE